ncbi:MAG: hypothetical protein HKN43_06585 [Rhodothermales bacterium]|nr:hypothetical protein [Rhodothermales bacterium]
MQTDRVSVYAQGNDLDQRQSMELIYPAFIDITIEIMKRIVLRLLLQIVIANYVVVIDTA